MNDLGEEYLDRIISVLEATVAERNEQIARLERQLGRRSTHAADAPAQKAAVKNRVTLPAELNAQSSVRARDRKLSSNASSATAQRKVSIADPTVDPICLALSTVALPDLTPVATVGSGTFGSVRLVTHSFKDESDGGADSTCTLVIALKRLSKSFLVEQGLEEQVRRERDAMIELWGHPNICRMYESRNDRDCLYLLLEFIPGGELLSVLVPEISKLLMRGTGGISVPAARFYCGCVALALTHIHACSYAYRDLKLENLLLTATGSVKLVDFGLAKRLDVRNNERTYTECGSAEYMAPESLFRPTSTPSDSGDAASKAHAHDRGVDLWALGVLLHELLTGQTPFLERSHLRTKKRIRAVTTESPFEPSPSFQRNFPAAAQLVTALFSADPARRPGYHELVSSGSTTSTIGTARSGEGSSSPSLLRHPWFRVGEPKQESYPEPDGVLESDVDTPDDEDEDAEKEEEEEPAPAEAGPADPSVPPERADSFFDSVLRGCAVPPFVPALDGPTDVRHFDPLDDSELPPLTPYVSVSRSSEGEGEGEGGERSLARKASISTHWDQRVSEVCSSNSCNSNSRKASRKMSRSRKGSRQATLQRLRSESSAKGTLAHDRVLGGAEALARSLEDAS